MAFSHQTVLLSEAVSLLEPKEGKVIVDGTLGGGGHSEALLQAGASVVGVDRDPVAIDAASKRLERFGARFRPVLGNFGDLPSLLGGIGQGPVDGVLVDLGVSSPQLDEASRGFSFQKDGPLDMRMGPDAVSAADAIEQADEKALAKVLWEFGEERFSRQIARELKKAQPKTTLQAVEAVQRAVPRARWPKHIHVATRTFQALRIWVNGELEALAALLEALPRVLRLGGRAAIISFHSLEDRMVKQGFRALEGRCRCPPGLPVCQCGQGAFRVLTKKGITAGEAEVEANARARSARLRAVERAR